MYRFEITEVFLFNELESCGFDPLHCAKVSKAYGQMEAARYVSCGESTRRLATARGRLTGFLRRFRMESYYESCLDRAHERTRAYCDNE